MNKINFLPQKNILVEKAPWAWAFSLLFFELLVVAVIVLIFGDKTPSSMGGVIGIISASSFAQFAEFRSPGIFTSKIRRELGIKISILLILVGILPVYFSNAESEDPLSATTLLIVFFLAFIFSFGFHVLGFWYGARQAKKQLEKIAKKKDESTKP